MPALWTAPLALLALARVVMGWKEGEERTFYDDLCINPTATHDQIHEAYRYLRARLHPDKGDPRDKESFRMRNENFKRIQKAYEVLSHWPTRMKYDKHITYKQITRPYTKSSRPRPHSQKKAIENIAPTNTMGNPVHDNFELTEDGFLVVRNSGSILTSEIERILEAEDDNMSTICTMINRAKELCRSNLTSYSWFAHFESKCFLGSHSPETVLQTRTNSSFFTLHLYVGKKKYLEFEDMDSMPGKDVHQLQSPTSIETCTQLCEKNGFTAFVQWEGKVYFREGHFLNLLGDLHHIPGVTLHVRVPRY